MVSPNHLEGMVLKVSCGHGHLKRIEMYGNEGQQASQISNIDFNVIVLIGKEPSLGEFGVNRIIEMTINSPYNNILFLELLYQISHSLDRLLILGLNLNVHLNSRELFKDLLEQWNFLIFSPSLPAFVEMHLYSLLKAWQLLVIQVLYQAIHSTRSFNALVVMNNYSLVFGQMHIHFNCVSSVLQCLVEGSYCVFRIQSGASSMCNVKNLFVRYLFMTPQKSWILEQKE